jgi:hypothetical protein
MTDLQITDEFGLNTSVQLRDDSPLAKAKLTRTHKELPPPEHGVGMQTG